MKMPRTSGALVAAFLLAGCAKGVHLVETNPFHTPKSTFRRDVRVIGVAGTAIPEGLPDPTPITTRLDSLITATLSRAGYSVIRPESYAAVWARVMRETGGFANPETGVRDEARFAAIMFDVIDALGTDVHLDAVLIPKVAVVEAQFAAGRAYWDGTRQAINLGGPMKGFFAGSPDGTLGALSLQVTIRDAAGDTLYANAGGIEVLSKMDGREFVAVPRRELFSDPRRSERAVRIALAPLAP